MFKSNKKAKVGAATFISLGLLGDNDHDKDNENNKDRKEKKDNN